MKILHQNLDKRMHGMQKQTSEFLCTTGTTDYKTDMVWGIIDYKLIYSFINQQSLGI